MITFIWGSTFVIVKGALSDASPLPFLVVRFSFAAILLLAFLSRWHIDWQALVPGIVLGIFLFGGYAFQTWGLMYTTPSKSAFITGFSVIVVPLVALFHGYRMRAANVAGALLGLLGLYFLVLPSGIAAVNRGDLLTLFGSISFAFHIVLVGTYTRRHSFLHLVPIQIAVVGLLALVGLPLNPGWRFHLTGRLIFALIVTAVLATGLAFSVQNWAQQYTPPAHTALIFALEPVFAAVTSWVVMGEGLGGKVLLGSAFVLGGMVVSEVWGGAAPSPVES